MRPRVFPARPNRAREKKKKRKGESREVRPELPKGLAAPAGTPLPSLSGPGCKKKRKKGRDTDGTSRRPQLPLRLLAPASDELKTDALYVCAPEA